MIADNLHENQIESADQSAEPRVSETIELTTFDDTVGRQEYEEYSEYNFDPYQDQEISKVLSRVYKLGTYAWTQQMLPGAGVVNLRFPKVLWEKPNIRDKLSNFRYFRSDVKISIRVNATMMHAGKLLAVVVPRAESFVINRLSKNVRACTWYEHYIVSAGSSETVEFTVPCVIPTQYLDTDPGDEYGFFLLKLVVLHPLFHTAPDAPDVTVTVYASFENPQVAGLYVGQLPSNQGPSDNETKEKSTKHLASGVADSIADVSLSLSKVPIIGGIASTVSTVASVAGNVLRFFGLQKPTSIETNTTVDLRFGQSMAQGKGLDLSKKFTFNPDTVIGSDSEFYNDPRGNMMDFVKYAQTPVLLDNFKFDHTATSGQVVYQLATGYPTLHALEDTSFATTPMGICSYVTRFWRGSQKFSLVISATKFTRCRIEISWFPETQAPPNDIQSGDYVSHVFDINGDSVFNFTVPFLDNMPYLRTDPTDPQSATGVMFIRVVNPVVVQDANGGTDVWIALYTAAGEDAQFFGHNGLRPGLQLLYAPPELASNQFSPHQEFEKTFEPLNPADVVVLNDFQFGEKITSWKDIFMKFRLTTENEFSDRYSEFQRKLFRFSRTPTRYKLLYEEDANVLGSLVIEGNIGFDNHQGYHVWHTKYNPMIEFEVPRYRPNFFEVNNLGPTVGLLQDTIFAGPNNRTQVTIDSAIDPVYIFQALSDDASFSHMQYPGEIYVV